MFTGRKGANARCRDTRFRDSSGVPHDPQEWGGAVGEDGQLHVFTAKDATRDLAAGTYQVKWRSGITTDLIITESGSVVDGTSRRKVVDSPRVVPTEPGYVPADQIGGRTEPLGDPPVPFHHISRSLRKKVNKALDDRAKHLSRKARKVRAEAIKAVEKAASLVGWEWDRVDAGLAEALPRLSDSGLRAALAELEYRVELYSSRSWFTPQPKWKRELEERELAHATALRDAYDAELYARTLSRRASQTRNHDVWPDVWEAVVDGATEREISQAIARGVDLDELAWITAGVRPHNAEGVAAWDEHHEDTDAKDEIADGLVPSPNLTPFTREDVKELARRVKWPPFSYEDTDVMMRSHVRPFDAQLWWRVGARNARQIDQLMRLGLTAPVAMSYAKAGAVTFGDMAALARDKVPVEHASDYLRQRYTASTAGTT